ncbi:MAG TPA: tetratricopeptide repeat protein [Polyangiaceae bacterium]|nr:tetratricopeptide repeat protein [Polyangiaceae bacterium]
MVLGNYRHRQRLGRYAGIFALLGALGCASAAANLPQAGGATSSDDQAATLFQRGRDAAQRGDSVRAEQYLSLALDRGYDAERALPLLLQVCLSNSRLRAALDHAEPYLRDHPDAETLRYLVATIHVGLGQTNEARVELEQLLRASPDSSDAHYLLGVLDSDGDVESARTHFRTYLDVAPKGERAPEVRSRLAELAIREEQHLSARGTP